MRLIDADELLNELDRLDLDYGAMGGVAECIATIDNTPTIEPSKSTEQNVADVPSGDTISREEVHKVLSLLATEGGKDAKLLFSDAHESIDALPSADRPQVNSNSAEEQIAETCDRPKGEWRWTHGGQCSECGFHNSNFDFNFCPSCGADMRGGDPE